MDDYVIVQDPRNNIVLGVIENRQVPETIIRIHIEERDDGIHHQKVMCFVVSFIIIMVGGTMLF
jgi:hypothetical protein